jgi:hypothetical protein
MPDSYGLYDEATPEARNSIALLPVKLISITVAAHKFHLFMGGVCPITERIGFLELLPINAVDI